MRTSGGELGSSGPSGGYKSAPHSTHRKQERMKGSSYGITWRPSAPHAGDVAQGTSPQRRGPTIDAVLKLTDKGLVAPSESTGPNFNFPFWEAHIRRAHSRELAREYKLPMQKNNPLSPPPHAAVYIQGHLSDERSPIVWIPKHLWPRGPVWASSDLHSVIMVLDTFCGGGTYLGKSQQVLV